MLYKTLFYIKKENKAEKSSFCQLLDTCVHVVMLFYVNIKLYLIYSPNVYTYAQSQHSNGMFYCAQPLRDWDWDWGWGWERATRWYDTCTKVQRRRSLSYDDVACNWVPPPPNMLEEATWPDMRAGLVGPEY